MKAFAGKSTWVLLRRVGILAIVLIAASLRLRATNEMPPPIGGLMIERTGHTATLLADGRIVVVGGDADGSVEVFDPQAGSFGVIEARLATPRRLHAAAVLKSGELLIAGGVGSNGASLDSAELLDTATLSFVEFSSQMHVARTRPTLRVLPDGKVQAIGGDPDATMELFNSDGLYFSSLVHPAGNPDLLSAALKTQSRAAALPRPLGSLAPLRARIKVPILGPELVRLHHSRGGPAESHTLA